MRAILSLFNNMIPYTPEHLPPENINYEDIISDVGQANAALARYDGLLQGIINPGILLSPLTNEEAVLSSRIEGTQATVEEVLEHEAGQTYDLGKETDIQEIKNYRKALTLASEHLSSTSIRLGFIRQLHEILMDSVRGQDKHPGYFRTTQNWIGPKGCKIEEASFVPPAPHVLENALIEWENYLSFDEKDPLVQTAIVHAQFGILHPFNDGNGRIGRLLIPLYLYQKKALSAPMFYLSAYLEKNRESYYASLKSISSSGNWTPWISFFLKAITSQAKFNIDKTKLIIALYEETKKTIVEITKSPNSSLLTDAIFNRPIFQVNYLIQKLGIAVPTAHQLCRKLKENNILKTIREGSGRKASIYCFPSLLNIAEGKEFM